MRLRQPVGHQPHRMRRSSQPFSKTICPTGMLVRKDAAVFCGSPPGLACESDSALLFPSHRTRLGRSSDKSPQERNLLNQIKLAFLELQAFFCLSLTLFSSSSPSRASPIAFVSLAASFTNTISSYFREEQPISDGRPQISKRTPLSQPWLVARSANIAKHFFTLSFAGDSNRCACPLRTQHASTP